MCISRTTFAVRAQSHALLLLALGAASICSASSITLGTDNGGNAFPFAGPLAASRARISGSVCQ